MSLGRRFCADTGDLEGVERVNPPPERLWGIMTEYSALVGRFQNPRQDLSQGISPGIPTPIGNRDVYNVSDFQIALSIKNYYLKIAKILLDCDRHPGSRADVLVQGNPEAFGGVMRYLLALYEFDVSTIPPEDQMPSDGRPLELQAA